MHPVAEQIMDYITSALNEAPDTESREAVLDDVRDAVNRLLPSPNADEEELTVRYSDVRESLALILGSGTTNILGSLDDAVSNNLGD